MINEWKGIAEQWIIGLHIFQARSLQFWYSFTANANVFRRVFNYMTLNILNYTAGIGK
jgi:hypothetical protein